MRRHRTLICIAVEMADVSSAYATPCDPFLAARRAKRSVPVQREPGTGRGTCCFHCFHALSREGLLDVPVGSTRNLSTGERLKVTRLAQAGQADKAIGEYLRFVLDGEDPDMDMLNDPV